MNEEHEWKSVQAIAIIQFILSALLLLVLFALRSVAQSVPELAVVPAVAPQTMIAGFFLLLLLLSFWIVSGVGLLKRRKWADLVVRATNALLIVIASQGVLLIFVLFEPMMDLADVENNVRPVIIFTLFFVFVIYGGMFLGFPIFSLAMLSRRNVKSVFDRDVHAHLVSHISLPVAVLMLWQSLGALSLLLWILIDTRKFFFGAIISGVPAFLYVGVVAIGLGLSAMLLYKNSVLGWLLGFLVSIVHMASAAITFRGDITEILAEWQPDLEIDSVPGIDSFDTFQEDALFNVFLVMSFVSVAVYLVGLKKILDRLKSGEGS